MNTNPDSIRILCYGDSNTYGSYPGVHGKRYGSNVRWTGLLQNSLGSNFEVIEEGLGNRTIDLDDPRPDRSGKNGMEYIIPCLQTHRPIDLIILMLGSNDLKNFYSRSSQEIAQSMDAMVGVVKDYALDREGQPSKIILVAPIFVNDRSLKISENYIGTSDKSKQLAPKYKSIAEKNGCIFVDASKVAKPDVTDGLHLNPTGHKALAEKLTDICTKIWK